ncbi:MAG TPA: SUMF1/EgtB/PvdO family nonheme iron enzyme [Chitinophagales bacterium]|nr:SUMF1/EgtB/PvdO family nonheme iron enzyme [Chitinophagales bacterium]HRK25689.1 SUMF1/EgtB/PvdO family nonheme iron enzyme [Chitinophagales bacterium]
MKNLVKFPLQLMVVALMVITISSCSKKNPTSSATGWNYNDPKWGGFEAPEAKEQKTGPGLVLIPGGTFTMGAVEQDVTYDYDNIPRRVTVSSFYMDETEVSNIAYREYLYWLNRIFGEQYPELVRKAIPDTLVWLDELAYNEPYVRNYFRMPSYNEYPVVGVSWLQANEFCRWRTDRVNEGLMVKEGILELDPNQYGAEHFNTEAYLLGQYEGVEKKGMKNLDPNGPETRRVKFEDGVLLPDYRLPTEAEWEYAALAITSESDKEERFTDRKIYPWKGEGVRHAQHGKWHGDMLANFKRGAGDYMGVAGRLNDNAEITAPVKSYIPNDFGLYNMGGNVSEWCLDVYRPMTSLDANDFNPFRGNEFETRVTDAGGAPAPKDSLGRIQYRQLTEDEIGNRTNFRKADVKNYRDGDDMSQAVYESDKTTLISDKSRVVKGGSWADLAYWLSPGTRRYMDEDQASATVGFRCAMIRMGSPDGKKIKAPKTKKVKTY